MTKGRSLKKMPRERERSEMEKEDSLVSQVHPLKGLTVPGCCEIPHILLMLPPFA